MAAISALVPPDMPAPKALRRSLRLLPMLLTFIVGLALTTLSVTVVEKWQRDIATLALEKQGSAYVKTMRQALFMLMNDMRAIRKLHQIDGSLSDATFQAFLDRGMDRQSGIHAVEWVAHVPESDRPSVIRTIRNRGVFDFMIRDYGSEYRIAEGRDAYFPVLLTAPKDHDGDRLGMDLATVPAFQQAMTAAKSGEDFFTSIALPVTEDRHTRFQMRIFLPVTPPGAETLNGFVAGLVYIDDLVENILGDPEQGNKFHLAIYEEGTSGFDRQIYRSGWRQQGADRTTGPFDARRADIRWNETITVAQKKWRLYFARVEGVEARHYTSLFIGIAGLLCTGALMTYLWWSHRHMKQVENLVAARTRSLFDVNRSLHKEVAERRKAEERLFYSAYHDTLTDCANRRSFNETLQARFEQARLSGNWQFAVLFIDLDRLKYVNDTFGHEEGDAVILETANRITAAVRGKDQLARLGGDEFAIILEDMDSNQAGLDIANRILARLRDPFMIRDEAFFTSGSIGLARADSTYQQPADLLRDADTAMYHAKKAGRNQHAVFTRDMRHMALRQIRLQSDLKEAVARQQFHLVFQPVFDVANKRLYGFEALIRWHHPTEGLIPPDDFIRLAEELGLIHDIGQWVIETALSDLAHIQAMPGFDDLRMNINVSPLQIPKPGLLHSLEAALARHHLNPEHCQIEITESALGTSAEEMADYLVRLKETGIRILVDDFGTEQASLNHLSLFPVDGLKVDKSFINDMEQDETKRRLVEILIELKDVLGLSITAEGVENTRQLHLLANMDCTYIQGYLCGKPTSLQDILAILEGRDTTAAPWQVRLPN